jgi:predicted restriction endonuclease
MSAYDYTGSSVTGVSTQKETLKTLQSYVKSFGTLYGAGMPYEEYKAAMNYMWEDKTEYNKAPVKNLSRYQEHHELQYLCGYLEEAVQISGRLPL